MKSEAHWQKIGLHPHHGICVPLFSLRTKKSCGIGEFSDLIALIDWCKSLKLDCIQLLPLNDTGDDNSPYNPLSSCALDPVYLSLADLAIPNLESLFAVVNEEPRVNRNEILKKKIPLLRQLFKETFALVSKTESYQMFFKENAHWLEPYALFKYLKQRHENRCWTDWPKPYPTPDPSELDFHFFLQFHCFDQMKKVHAHATHLGIFIKGDIPILLSVDSVDVWAEPQFFDLKFAAGAPPDPYNQQGQNWGFPIFNWEEMKKNNYSWWKRRLKVAENFFHIWRIDHVVGLFRIWAIPRKKGTPGFIPPERSLWGAQGTEILEMLLDATSLLPIAEDLGTIPPEVYVIEKSLKICGTKVMRWEKNSQTGKFIPFDQYEPFSMTTLSTPDMPTLELWWRNLPAESVPFAEFMGWSYHPILTTKQRLAILHAAHHTTSLFHINLLQEYLALFPELSWINPEADRINFPGTTLATNWTYRFRPFLEEIIGHKGLTLAFEHILSL